MSTYLKSQMNWVRFLIIGLLFATGFGTTANAQDIILKQDGSEIKTKVLEITDQQVKYKMFDFQEGPTRNINKSEVFMITYENGQKEVFNKLNETNTYLSKQQVTKNKKRTIFGLDTGFGGSFDVDSNGKKSKTWSASAFGMRVTHQFNPYFGIDFVKMNWIIEIGPSKDHNPWIMRFQLTPGIRGNTPVFFKTMSVYAAFRLGYGMFVTQYSSLFEGLCLETELGLNLTPTVFTGFSYNYHKSFYKSKPLDYATHIFSFRIGFNFGKAKVENKESRNIKNSETFPEQVHTQIPATPLTPLQIEFYQIGNNDKAMLEFFHKNDFKGYHKRYMVACKQKNKATGWLVSGSIFTATGIAVLVGRAIVVKNAHPYEVKINNNYRGLTVTGSLLIGIGQVFIITCIPIYVKAASWKKTIKNDFVKEQFVGKYSYELDLNIGITQNGNIGLTLNF